MPKSHKKKHKHKHEGTEINDIELDADASNEHKHKHKHKHRSDHRSEHRSEQRHHSHAHEHEHQHVNENKNHVNEEKGRRRPNLNRSTTSKFIESFFGIQVNSVQKKKIPPGFTLMHTKTGRPYLEKINNGSDVDALKAESEHLRPNLSICCSATVIKENYGTGIYLYFDFLKFVTLTNFVLFLFALFNTSAHFYYDRNYYSKSLYQNLYISHYSHKVYVIWLITTIICVLLWFLFGPIYAIKVGKFFSSEDEEDFEGDEFEDSDEILDNHRVTHGQRAYRFAISYVVTALLLAISAGGTFGLVLLNGYYDDVGNIIASIAVAILIKTINFIWYFICGRLTAFEKHKTWTSHRKNNTIKYYLFKMFNVLVMYLLRYFFLQNKFDFINSLSKYDKDLEKFNKFTDGIPVNSSPCEIDKIGDQMLFIILLDITVSNLWELIWPSILYRIKKRNAETNKRSNESARPDFDVADEYLEIFYRQFILYLGMTVFPLITFLGLIANILEYHLDKYRLFRICREPNRMDGSMKKFIVFYLFTSAFLATFCFPYGALWVSMGQVTTNCGNSTMFQDKIIKF